MNRSAKRAARLAILAALGAAILLLVRFLPAGRLGLMLAASFPVCAALMMYGAGWASAVFAVTAALGFLLCPGTTAIGYTLFFGYYPIVKSLIERLKGARLCLILKGMVYIVVFILYWVFARAMFSGADAVLPWYAVFFLGALVFAVYDWCYSAAIRVYIEKIARYIS